MNKNIKKYVKVGIFGVLTFLALPINSINAKTVNANSSNSSNGNVIINSNYNYYYIEDHYNQNNVTENKEDNKQEDKNSEEIKEEVKKEFKKINIKDVTGVNINKEIDSFKSWIRVKNNNAKFLYENNIMKTGDSITYIVEYFNGSKKEINTLFIIELPENIEVLNDDIEKENILKENGITKITLKVDNVEIGKVKSFEIKVKVLEDKSFTDEKKHSKTIYSKLTSKFNETEDTSYVMQTYINDKIKKQEKIIPSVFLTDVVNIKRKSDEITRAELAKMIFDLDFVNFGKSEEKFADNNEISDIAKNAVYSVTKEGIMQAYLDNTFKPNNPVIRDDFFKIVTEIRRKVSNSKVKVTDPVYYYESILKQKNNELTDYKNEIMELVRENIISNKSNKRSDEYIKREEAIKVLNSIIYSGVKFKTNQLKISENGDFTYFYNI